MKKILAFIAALAILISLAACNKDGAGASGSADDTPPAESGSQGGIAIPGADDKNDANGSEDSKNDGADSQPQSKPAVVSVAVADEALLAKPDEFDEFIDDTSEYQVKVAFTVNVAVKEFKYVEIVFDDGPESGFSVGQELYTMDELLPERPLVIALAFAGDTPNRAITYLDETGETRIFAVCMSGEDGSILLSEI